MCQAAASTSYWIFTDHNGFAISRHVISFQDNHFVLLQSYSSSFSLINALSDKPGAKIKSGAQARRTQQRPCKAVV